MIDRYTTPEMAALWAPEAKFATWLEIELLACEAQAELGLVPREAAAWLRRTARVGSPARIGEIERTQTQHDVVAFLRSVAEETGEDVRYLHRGLGSSDVVDTALAVHLRRAADLLLRELGRLTAALRDLAHAHRHTLMAGRTHGMHAEPVTFGLKAALWYDEVHRAGERLARAREQVRVGKISGEVGTYAHLDPAVEAYVCRELDLHPARIASQILQRDRHAEFLSAIAIAGGTLEKIAVEIRSLARTEIGEVAEPFRAGQTGSSAMPHKRNPILCERITGLARVLRGYAQMGMEDQALWGERDISHSSVERIALPGATAVLHYMLQTMVAVVQGLVVYPERMRANLERSGGLVFSHRVLLALVDRGYAREAAYRVVQDAAAEAMDGGTTFREALAHSGGLTPGEVDALFDYGPYLAHVDAILDRVFAGEASGADGTGGLPREAAPAGPRAATPPPVGTGRDR